MNATDQPRPGWPEMLRAFGRIGLLSFGGPAAQIAVMHRELVDIRPWLTERRFLDALSFCMLLPGPEAMQLATYCGWRLRGIAGGLLAGALFVLPGAAVMLALALAYLQWGRLAPVEAAFLGVKAAVVVIVVQALLKVARKALETRDRWVIAGLSFVAIFAFAVPFPAIVIAAGLYGAWAARGSDAPPPATRPRARSTLAVAATGLTLWWGPVLALWLAGQTLLTQIALFFSKLAVVTFGGAYAVLAYMTQQVVSHHGWITTADMMDGLGLAETTPGPLILVTQFVGTLAGAHAGGTGLAVAAAAVVLWVTFVPCFLWIFAGAPYIDWIASRPRLTGALGAITAAVVGVILNLSLWFGTHVFFATVETLRAGPLHLIAPDFTSLDPVALGLALAAGVGLLWLRLGLLPVLGLAALGGMVLGTIA